MSKKETSEYWHSIAGGAFIVIMIGLLIGIYMAIWWDVKVGQKVCFSSLILIIPSYGIGKYGDYIKKNYED